MNDCHDKCLISDSNQLEPLKGYEKDYLVKSHPVGFVFCARKPTNAELKRHYAHYPENPPLSPITLSRYRVLLDEFERYRKTGRLLDIGCGTGFFLEEAKKKGWEVFGTEFNESYVSICQGKGINMKQGSLCSNWYPSGFFDVIVSFEVIEHIYDPKEQVQIMFRSLRCGGLLHFTTPNFNAIERFILGPKYNVIQYPEHLSYYTKRTIHYLMTRSGFKRKKLITTGISITRLKAGFINGGKLQNREGNLDEIVRDKLENSRLLNLIKTIVNVFLDFFTLGNALKGWYVKPA